MILRANLFNSPAGSSPVITNATFKLESVQKAAIYGPRQRYIAPFWPYIHSTINIRPYSGKTTLILSMILLLPYEGSIKIDGIEARDIPRDKFKEIFTIIPESPVTFPSASIRQNLLTDEILDPSRADAALNADGIRFLFDNNMDERLTLIAKLLHGVGLSDIVRDAGGVNTKFSSLVLSPTQRQKFSLAQGLAKYYAMRTKMAIVDSTTSRVNAEGLERMNSLIDEILGVNPDCMVITLASHADAIEGSQYVARIAGGRVFKFVVESMLRNKASSSRNRVSKRVLKTRGMLSEEELVGEIARRSEQGTRERGRRLPSPTPATSSSSQCQSSSDPVAGPSTSPESSAPESPSQAPLSPTVNPTPLTYGARRLSRSPGNGRHPRPLSEAPTSMGRRFEPARRRNGRTLRRPVPVARPRSPPGSDDSEDYTTREIPSWMKDFADDSVDQLRRYEMYTRIFEFGSIRMQTLLVQHRIRDTAALQSYHRRNESQDPEVVWEQWQETEALLAYYNKLERAVLAARIARQNGLC